MLPDKKVEVDGARLHALVGDPETAENRYIRAFTRPDRPRSYDALCELVVQVTNLTEEEVDLMTAAETTELMKTISEEINRQAVNPQKGEGSSPTETTEPKRSQPGGVTP